MSLLLGWDGLGLTSYVLVVFYQNERRCNAGIITIIRNRIGDVAILLACAFRYGYGRWNFFYWDETQVRLIISILVVIAGCTKRAQIPFSAWLPAAMAAPTPVSALVHSSTLVTAGVYILIRYNYILINRRLRNLLAFIAVVTIFIAGVGANFEEDLKKVVALSTLRQLGLIIGILRLGWSNLAFFHLITHAIFKRTLFICAGFIIHGGIGSQDIRGVSGLFLSSPRIRIAISITNIALSGFPFLAGFYSKDLRLESVFNARDNFWLVRGIVVSTGLTVSYRLRFIFLRMKRERRGVSLNRASGCRNDVLKSGYGLLTLRVVGGRVVFWGFLGSEGGFVLASWEKLYIIVISVVCVLVGLTFLNNYKGTIEIKYVYQFAKVPLGQIWFLRFLSTYIVTNPLIKLREGRFKTIEKGWLEHCGGQGGKNIALSLGNLNQTSQSSLLVKNYIGFIVLAILVLSLIVY